MSTPRLEAFLARLYTHDALLRDFLRAPAETARAAGLGDEEVRAIAECDRDGLVMAARSFRAKREARRRC
jgi:hypothetical protein